MSKIFLFFCIFLFPAMVLAQQKRQVTGIVTDNRGVRLPFAAVFAENTTINTVANEQGFYRLRLNPGPYK
ncbi:MAG: hypothetical protein EOP42_33570, partial [Sphingobacteriaceae bacterium]